MIEAYLVKATFSGHNITSLQYCDSPIEAVTEVLEYCEDDLPVDAAVTFTLRCMTAQDIAAWEKGGAL